MYVVLQLLPTDSTSPAPTVPLPFLISTAIIDALSLPTSTSMQLPIKHYGMIIIFIKYIADADVDLPVPVDLSFNTLAPNSTSQ